MPASNDPPSNQPASSDPAVAIQQAKQQFEQAMQALERSQWDQAATGFEAVTRLAPHVEAGHFNLGNALFELGRFPDAIQAYRQAFELSPRAGTLNNLGNAYSASYQWPQASDCYRRALGMLDSQPELADAAEKNSLVNNLGRALQHWGRHSEAALLYRHYWLRSPSLQHLHNLLRSSPWLPADQPTRDILSAVDALPSPTAETLILAADCYHHLSLYNDELVCLVKANQLTSNQPQVLARIARHQQFRGRHPEATLCLHRSLTTTSASPSLQSSWLRNSLYQPSTNFEQLHREAIAWAAAHAPSAVQNHAQHAAQPEIKRIGWIITEAMSDYLLDSLGDITFELQAMAVECHFYSDRIIASAGTSRLKQRVQESLKAAWTTTAHLTDSQLHEAIVADKLDCLIDGSGHGHQQRLLVFARRSAPVQIAIVDVGMTSGLDCLDGLLSDTRLIPEAAREQFTESLVNTDPFTYLKVNAHSQSAWQLRSSIAPTEAERQRSGALRLGILCSPDRMTRDFLVSVANALAELPGATVCMAHATYIDPGLRLEIIERCVQAGLPQSQLQAEVVSETDYCQWLTKVDLLIDPMPLGQVNSVVAALSVGVPVVACEGNNMASRITASLLNHLGLNAYVAPSGSPYPDTIVRTAREVQHLACDPELLSDLQQSIRQRLLNSHLCNASSYAQELVRAMRMMAARHSNSL